MRQERGLDEPHGQVFVEEFAEELEFGLRDRVDWAYRQGLSVF